MSCHLCDDAGQYVTRTVPYEFTYQGRQIRKAYTYVAPCGCCERGRRISEARVRKGIRGDRQEAA